MQENELITNKELREQAIERIDVLEKVKHLFLIPEMDVMTIRQVAEYYEVDFEVVKKCYLRNKSEIDEDGTRNESLKSLKGRYVPLKIEHGKCILKVTDSITIEVPNRGIRVFSKRAILRIGMLLRDSPIAQEVRTQILNTFETTSTEQKTEAIDKEESLYMAYAKAAIDGSKEELEAAAKQVFEFKNRHIAKLEEDKEELKTNNKALAGKILEWGSKE